MGKAAGFVAFRQELEVMAVGYSQASPAIAHVTQLANHVP